MNQAHAREAGEGFHRLVWEGTLTAIPHALLATIFTPIIVGVELLLVRSDAVNLLLLGITIAGVHSLVVLSTLGYVASMMLEVRRGLRGEAGRIVTWARVKRARETVEHSRKARIVYRTLMPFNWANPLNPLGFLVTHIAFGVLTPALRMEYLLDVGQDPESLPMFPDEDAPLPDDTENTWRKFSATGTSRLLMPV